MVNCQETREPDKNEKNIASPPIEELSVLIVQGVPENTETDGEIEIVGLFLEFIEEIEISEIENLQIY